MESYKAVIRGGLGKKQKSKCYENISRKKEKFSLMEDMNEEEKKDVCNEKMKCNKSDEMENCNNGQENDVCAKMTRAIQDLDKNRAEKKRLKNKKSMEGFEKEEHKLQIFKNSYFYQHAKDLMNLEIKSQVNNKVNYHGNQREPIKNENMNNEAQEDNRSKESYHQSNSCEETPLKELIMVAVENDCEEIRRRAVENEDKETVCDEDEDKTLDDSMEHFKDDSLDELQDYKFRGGSEGTYCPTVEELARQSIHRYMGRTYMLSPELTSKETFMRPFEEFPPLADILNEPCTSSSKIQKDLSECGDPHSDNKEEDWTKDMDSENAVEDDETDNAQISDKESCNEHEEKETDTVDEAEIIVSLRDNKSWTSILDQIEADASSLDEAVQDLFGQMKEMKITLFQCTDLLHDIDTLGWQRSQVKHQGQDCLPPVAVNHCKKKELTQPQTLAVEPTKGDHSHPLQDADSNGSSGQKPGDRNKGSKENSRRDEDEKDVDEKEHPPDDRDNSGKTNSTSDNDKATGEDHDKEMESTSPAVNHKYRRKYGLDDAKLTELLGKLANQKEAIPPDILQEVNNCLVECLTTRWSEGIEKLNECNVCSCLLSLLSHFGACLVEYENCSMCLKSFNMIQYHLKSCSMIKEPESCPVVLCQKIQTKLRQDLDIDKNLKLWQRLKKYLARFSGRGKCGGDTGGEYNSMDFLSLNSMGTSSLRSMGSSSLRPTIMSSSVRSPRTSTGQRPSTGFLPSLGIIPEKSSFSSTYPTGRQSRSAPLMTKNKGTGEIIYSKEAENLPSRLRPERLSLSNEPKTRVSSPRQPRVSFAKVVEQTEEQTVADTTPVPVEDYEDIKYEFSGKIYGGQGTHSMPIGAQPLDIYDEQLLSLNNQPTGTPGIGEVVYGTRDQLLIVINHWSQLKMSQGQLKTRHIREEGVILSDYKELFELFGTRYQKNFQWIRLTHLGSGMSGKCHLAMDYNTEHKFCIKKIYLVKYEKQELEIWSELSHPNIVQLYGAIRRDMKIYIFAEFIDGGCLTETINNHKEMHQRLSHKMALSYLKQLLEVLVYLEKKSIIHEDIKGDNILLRKGSMKIAVTDFGVARRVIQQCTRGKSPVGTPTHFSPEKAESKGHGPKSDVWSAICVLIHMLSGSPPWIRRYKNVNTLNYIIVSKEAPISDLPGNIRKEVRQLVEMGFNKDPKSRPNPAELLQHPAFKLLDEFNNPETTFSILSSMELNSFRRNMEGHSIAGNTSREEYGIPDIANTVPGTTIKAGHQKGVSVVQPFEVTSPEKNSLLPSSGVFVEHPDANANFEELGVAFPPSKPAYIEEDWMKYILKYLNDDFFGTLPQRVQNLIVNPVYGIQLYDPAPTPENQNIEENIEEQIRSIIEPHNTEDIEPLPNFDILLEDPITEPQQAIPLAVQDLMNSALEEGLQRLTDNTFSEGSVEPFDSEQYDEELKNLRKELRTPEILDIKAQESLMNLLQNSNAGLTDSYNRECNIPEEEQPTTIIDPETIDNKPSDQSENTIMETGQNVTSTVSPSEERNSTLEQQEDVKGEDRKIVLEIQQTEGNVSQESLNPVLPNFNQIIEHKGSDEEELCLSDDMFGDGQQATGQAVGEDDKIIIKKSSGAIPKASNNVAMQPAPTQGGAIENKASHPFHKSYSQPAELHQSTHPQHQQGLRTSYSNPAISDGSPQQILTHSRSQQFSFANQNRPEEQRDQSNGRGTQHVDQYYQQSSIQQITRRAIPNLPKLDIHNRQRNKSETHVTGVYTPSQLKASPVFVKSPMSAPVLQYVPSGSRSSERRGSPDRRGSFNSQIDQKDEEIRELFRDISQHSETSHENSILEELEELPVDRDGHNIATEDDNDYESILQNYVNPYVQDGANNNNGVRLKILREGNILLKMKLMGEDCKNSWKTILEKEIIDMIHRAGHKKFSLQSGTHYLNLDARPEMGHEIHLEVVDVYDNAPWHCEASMINFFSFP